MARGRSERHAGLKLEGPCAVEIPRARHTTLAFASPSYCSEKHLSHGQSTEEGAEMRRRPPRQQQSANPMVSFLSSLTSHSQAPRNGAQARRKTAVPLRYATPQRAPSRARVSAGGYRSDAALAGAYNGDRAQASASWMRCALKGRGLHVVRTGGRARHVAIARSSHGAAAPAATSDS
jgi:hypothetical protein